MSNSQDDLLIETMKNINHMVNKLDSKLDAMQEILIKNTVVLEVHEARSTSSEKRLDLLETRQSKIEKKADRLHGFFFYSGAILAILGGLAALFHDSVDTILALFRHK